MCCEATAPNAEGEIEDELRGCLKNADGLVILTFLEEWEGEREISREGKYGSSTAR